MFGTCMWTFYMLVEAVLEFAEGEVWRPAGKPGLCVIFSACM